MTMTDPIADMLTRIRNAVRTRNEQVDVPISKLKLELIRILKGEGFVDDFKVLELGPRAFLRIFLKYSRDGESVIRGLRRVSTPGRRVYVGADEIAKPMKSFGIAVISTPKGIMTSKQARRDRVGGEVLCMIW